MKETQERLDFWNELFNTLKRYTLQDLYRCYKRDFKGEGDKDISERTMKGDFQKLRELGAKLETKRFGNRDETLNRAEKCHYFYKDSFVLYTKPEFTSEDAKHIEEVLGLLNPFLYLPQLKGLQIRLSKIKQQLNLSNDSTSEASGIIGFDQIPNLQGIHRLEYFYNAIIAQKTLFIHYKPFDKVSKSVTLHPYYLKQFRNRWFLYGLNVDKQKIFHYALDRIQWVEPSPLPFIKNTFIDLKNHFTDIIGVTRAETAVSFKILLKVQKPRAYYIHTKPWHPSQEIERDEDTYMIFKLNLIINKELEAQLLEYGKDLEVLEPLLLRQKIHDILQEAIGYYQ